VAESSRPEVVIGLVGATGTDLGALARVIEESLARFGYTCQHIRLIALLKELPTYSAALPESPEEERISKAMDAGDRFRSESERADALALLGLGAIRSTRESITGNATKLSPDTAYILRSLKRPEEVETLRRIYGSGFFLIGAFAHRKNRVADIASRIGESHHSADVERYRAKAEELIQRDQDEDGLKFGQALRDTYPLADYFVDVSKTSTIKASIDRFFDLVFMHPFRTPTKDEYGMFHAQGAALRSAALGRQVGAVVASTSGDIVSVGTNEVPKSGGGLYWCDDEQDGRDFTLGHDSMDRLRRTMLGEMVERLKRGGWLAPSKATVPEADLVEQLLAKGVPESMKGSQIMNVLEFGRIVHGEMAAIVDAARRGVSLAGHTMFVTTFPCHNCARHIVAAGIARVVYIEPYPKSLANTLHMDSLNSEGEDGGTQIGFESYIGLAPARYMEFFRMPVRKDSDGRIVEWLPLTQRPRIAAGDQVLALVKEAQEFNFIKPSIDTILSKEKEGGE
jgi:deoxycytidylate deaminase